jgi:hypothetical protein
MERKFEAVYGRMIKVDRLGKICCDGGRELSGFCRSSAHVERKERGWGSSAQRQIGKAKSAMVFGSHTSDPPNAHAKERRNC